MKRLLVVDDSAFMRDLLALTFDAAEVEVRVVPSAAEARRALADSTPDAIVLDVDLGSGESGIELCQGLSAAPGAPPILLLTSLDREQDRARGLAAGARAYLTKPFSPLQLRAELEAAWARTPT